MIEGGDKATGLVEFLRLSIVGKTELASLWDLDYSAFVGCSLCPLLVPLILISRKQFKKR